MITKLMGGLVSAHVGDITWHRVEDHEPPQKTLLMVCGDSGYRTFNQKFLTLAYVDEEYRPSLGDELRWLSVQNDELTDQSWRPTHWAFPMDLPELEEKAT